MQKDSTAKQKGRRYRHQPSAYQAIATLQSLDAPGRDAEAVARLCAVLSLWVLFMLETDPAAAAPRIYRAILDAWKERREGLPEGGLRDETDKETCAYHGAVLDALDGVTGKPPRGMFPFESKKRAALLQAAAKLHTRVAARLNEWRRVYLPGVQAEPVACQQDLLDDGAAGRRVDELRARLDCLTDITDESERFRIEREIYDLTRGTEVSEEWPMHIGGEGD